MAEYTVNLTDPLSPSISIPPKGVNGPGTPVADTSLRLYGAGYVNWGEAVNENFVRLLENFMGASAPVNPVAGQLWAETRLFYRDSVSGFVYKYDVTPGSGTYHQWVQITVTSQATASTAVVGAYWWNTSDSKLYEYQSAYDGVAPSWMWRRSATGSGVPAGAPETQLKMFNSAAEDWEGVGVVTISSSTASPSDNQAGTLRYDNVTDTLYVWDGLAWVGFVNSTAPTFSGNVDLNNNFVINVADAVNPQDALNLRTGNSLYVNVAGDTMTGDLNLGANQLNFSNMFLNEGNGSITVAPDIRFAAAGLITADNSIYNIVDDGNIGSGNFVVAKGAENTTSHTPLVTVYNDGEVRSNVASYETLVGNNNTLVNKKYVDDSIAVLPGKQTISIPATALRPRATNGCAFLSTYTGAAGQPDVDFLAFDGDVDEYAKIAIPMPKGWNESTVSATFQWKRASGTSAVSVVWGVRAVALSDGDAITTAFAGVAIDDAAKASATTIGISDETGPLTIAGSPQQGDLVLFEFYRIATHGSDTMAGEDAHLISVRLHYTTNTTNDA